MVLYVCGQLPILSIVVKGRLGKANPVRICVYKFVTQEHVTVLGYRLPRFMHMQGRCEVVIGKVLLRGAVRVITPAMTLSLSLIVR